VERVDEVLVLRVLGHLGHPRHQLALQRRRADVEDLEEL